MKEVVRKWVEKTKVALMEEERKEAIVRKFKEIFGIEPDIVRWDADQILEARAQIKEELDGADFMILDRKVNEVVFIMYEEKDEIFDVHWRFETRRRHWHHCYRWSKRLGPYTAIVEIFAKVS